MATYKVTLISEAEGLNQTIEVDYFANDSFWGATLSGGNDLTVTIEH